MSDQSDWAAPGSGPRPPEQGWAPPPGHGSPAGPQAAPKPGVIPLRPLGVTELLDGAVSFIRSNPLVTLGLSAVVITITQLIQVPVTALLLDRLTGLTANPEQVPTSEDIAGLVGPAVGGGLLSVFVSFIAITVLTGLLIMALGQAVLGRRMALGEAWAATRGRIPGLLALSLLTSLALVAVVAVGALPGVIAALAGASAGAVVAITVVGVLAGVCLAIYLGVSWSMITPAYVLEGIPAMSTFRRSARLVRPRWWGVFGILLLSALITSIVAAVLGTPFSLLGTFLGGGGGDPATGLAAAPTLLGTVITAVGTIIASTITAPFGAGVTGLLYFDQRIRREAFDLELLRAVESPQQLQKQPPLPDARHPDPQPPPRP